MWALSFISKSDLIKHVKKTITEKYLETLKSFDLEKFNSNVIDPIKLLFDSKIYKKNIEVIIAEEISRQRDKTNNNSVGYFHQYIFQYISKCEVPKQGFDIIFSKNDDEKIYVEMKNKHNTMNSSSAKSTYIKLQNKVLPNRRTLGFLVEVIAKKSQNSEWVTTIDKMKVSHQRIRRVSIDKFYEIVTGQSDAFYKLCNTLPSILDEILFMSNHLIVEEDKVIEELKQINPDLVWSLFELGFHSYLGFGKKI